MVAGVHLGLNPKDLPVPRHAVRVHSNERVALAEQLDKWIELLRLQRAIKRYLSFALGFLDKNLLPFCRRQLAQFSEDLTSGLGSGAAIGSTGQINNHVEPQQYDK